MKAENGKTYAQVVDGKAHWIFTEADLPEWADDAFTVVDVTGSVPDIGTPWNGSVFVSVTETLAEAQDTKIAQLNIACQQAITAGFTSTALGASYTYPSQITDQQNLAANVLSSLLPGIDGSWTTLQLCQSPSGEWNYVAHTASEIQQVGKDAKSVVLSSLVHNATQKSAVAAATTLEAVQAIVW